MKKKNSCRRFPALMILSILMIAPMLWLKIGWNALNRFNVDEGKPAGSPVLEGAEVAGHQKKTLPEQKEETIPEQATPAPDSPVKETLTEETSVKSKEEFFSTVLFIGDSRSVGLSEYAGLEGADFFASSGMNVFRLWDKEILVANVGKCTLEDLLKQKTYDTIFLMSGINELGYAHAAIVRQYAETVQAIEALQPEAALYLCANLHVTKTRSDQDDIYNNENIDWLNGEIAGLADGNQTIYIDINSLFDDAQEALRSDYSGDGAHPYGKYYQEWGQWLYETCNGQETD